MNYLVIFSALIIATTQLLFGQQNTDEQIQQLKTELTTLRAQLDSLQAAQGMTTTDESELENVEERLEKRLRELENKIDAVSRATSSVIMNPKITAFINVAGRKDNATVMDYSGTAEIGSKVYLRSFELDLRNPVDPYADAVAILSVENEAGEGYALDPEEVYGLIKRLPFLETAPLGMKIKLGKFRPAFGVSNRTHMHDLPWTTRPLIVSHYLGTEHGNFFESGFNPVGIDMDFFLPTLIPEVTNEASLSLITPGEIGLPGERNPNRSAALVSHLNFSKDWENIHMLTVGASLYGEGDFFPSSSDNENDGLSVLGVDVTYKWTPAEERASRSIVAGGEFMTASQLLNDPNTGYVRSNPYGWYGYLQYQTSYWLYLGARYDWLEEPVVEKPVTQSFAAYATYYTSEFFRLRLGYERQWSELPQNDNIGSVMFDVNFVFGSHPTEPYWVNR